jgi:hypothetical protein
MILITISISVYRSSQKTRLVSSKYNRGIELPLSSSKIIMNSKKKAFSNSMPSFTQENRKSNYQSYAYNGTE